MILPEIFSYLDLLKCYSFFISDPVNNYKYRYFIMTLLINNLYWNTTPELAKRNSKGHKEWSRLQELLTSLPIIPTRSVHHHSSTLMLKMLTASVLISSPKLPLIFKASLESTLSIKSYIHIVFLIVPYSPNRFWWLIFTIIPYCICENNEYWQIIRKK